MKRLLLDRLDWLPEELEAEDYLLLSAVLLLPWAFGGVELWAYRTASLLIACAAAVAVWKRGRAGLFPRGARWLLPAFLLGAWALVQVVPLPPGAVRALSPRADRLYREAYPGYPGAPPGGWAETVEQKALAEVPEADGTPAPRGPADSFHVTPAGRWSGWRALSLETDATIERFFWYAALLLAFVLAKRRASTVEVASAYRTALLVLFGALSACALLQAVYWNGKLLWVRTVDPAAHPLGPYVNPTHFAGVMEIAVPWLAGVACASFLAGRGRPWRDTHAPLAAGAAFFCLVAAFLSASRMAALLVGLSLTLLVVFLAWRSRARKWMLLGLAAGWCLATVLAFQLRLGDRIRYLFEGAEAGAVENSRLLVWKASMPILRDFPVTGTGFGTFRFVIPGYLPPGELLSWLQVHNDYLEVILEGGIVAAALLLWLAAAFWRRTLRPSGWRGGYAAHPARLGLVLGVASLSVHAFVDFNHQIPANALLFVTAAALAMPRATREETGG